MLEERAATHALEAGPSVSSAELARDLLTQPLQATDLLARERSAALGLSIPGINLFTVGAALSIFLVRLRLRPANRDGHRPAPVRRWVNLNAHGDPVGGRLQGRPYQVDAEFLDLASLGCGGLDAGCAHASYFQPDNVAVNRDIFAAFIDRP